MACEHGLRWYSRRRLGYLFSLESGIEDVAVLFPSYIVVGSVVVHHQYACEVMETL